MINHRRIRILALACAGLAAGVAGAHVIPPEKLHPVAESYRRATFILNLNPVVWEQVDRDVVLIADARRPTLPPAISASPRWC